MKGLLQNQHEAEERRRLADPYHPSHHNRVHPSIVLAGLIAVITVVIRVVADPGPDMGFVIIAVGGTLAVGAYFLMRRYLRSK